MSWNLTTSGAAKAKAGENYDTSIGAEDLDKFCDDAEGTLNMRTKFDWVTNIASVGAQYSGALSDVVSSMVAMDMINYNMSGFTSRAEAQTMLDVQRDKVERGIKELEDANTKTAMGAI